MCAPHLSAPRLRPALHVLCLLALLGPGAAWSRPRQKPAPEDGAPATEGPVNIQKTFACMNRCNVALKQCTNKCSGDRACVEKCNQQTQTCREPCLGGSMGGKGKETMNCLLRCAKDQRGCDAKCGDDESCKQQCTDQSSECREPCLKGGVGERGRATFDCVVKCDKQKKACAKACQDEPGCAEGCDAKNRECRDPCLKNR